MRVRFCGGVCTSVSFTHHEMWLGQYPPEFLSVVVLWVAGDFFQYLEDEREKYHSEQKSTECGGAHTRTRTHAHTHITQICNSTKIIQNPSQSLNDIPLLTPVWSLRPIRETGQVFGPAPSSIVTPPHSMSASGGRGLAAKQAIIGETLMMSDSSVFA